jgi:hypothetical protein
MTAKGKRVLFDREPGFNFEETVLEFRLTYAGPLYSTQRDPVGGQPDKRAPHKHDIRADLHPQLKRLWAVTPFLKRGGRKPVFATFSDNAPQPYDAAALAKRYTMFGWNFVPLVTSDNGFFCGLEIDSCVLIRQEKSRLAI